MLTQLLTKRLGGEYVKRLKAKKVAPVLASAGQEEKPKENAENAD